MEVENITVEFVRVGNRARPLNEDAVIALMASIKEVGLRTPINVHVVDDLMDEDGAITDGVPFLVAGHHRLEACRRLGWEDIPAVVVTGSDVDFRLWEIAENLHRAELTVLERAEHVAEWIRLTKEKMVSDSLSETTSRGGRPGAAAEASRKLGINERQAQRAAKVDSLSDDAKAAAREVGLADNQSALLQAAQRPAAEQAEAIRNYEPARTKPAPAIKNAFESEEDWRRALFTVWNRGAQDWRDRAMETLDAPAFDRTPAARG